MAFNRLKKHKSPSTAKAPKPSKKKKTFDIDKIAGPKKRSRVKTEQQGINRSDHDYHGELASMSEGEVDGERGLVSNSSVDYTEADGLECETSDIMERSNEHRTDDGDEASSEDDMNDSESDSHTNVDDIASTSSFYRHVGHIITNEEANKLVKSKWQYKWEMPATGMLMSKWVGTGECLSKEVPEDLASRINPKLYKHWLDIYKASESGDFDARLRFFFSLCNSYRDIMHCDKKPFYLKGAQEDSSNMDAYLMHALNHVFKTRDIVVKNDAKLKKHQEGGKEILTASSSLDHGFTRPKIRGVKNLIIYSLPERKEFYPEIINMLEGSNMTCNVIFSRFDRLKLERIVGMSSSKRMLSSDKDIFVFC
ncbi:U3 small nucleolar RNA-associated protein 25 isoform X2 [Iris pallida]|uniref:U3 small nucleolar RNA-associated protein 25 isoform X2 n=2 Tax=Iris pallida TaxID=29817 RepID=A0AAX6H3Q2_IRIPA|nr:U3 small nucleolar RNA-associated protein 25 isoform X2 [Iris pallida]